MPATARRTPTPAARRPTAPNGPGAPQEPQQQDQRAFEQAHPRGRGGIWIKKGQGMGGTPDQNVQHLQNRLSALGYPTTADGAYGDQTEQSVLAFQAQHGLTTDGIVGPATTRALQTGQPGQAPLPDRVPEAVAATAQTGAAGSPAPSPTPAGAEGYGDAYRGKAGAAARAEQDYKLSGDADPSKAGDQNPAGQDLDSAGNVKPAKKSSSSSSSRSSSRSSSGRSSSRDGSVVQLGMGMGSHRGDKRVRDIQVMLDNIGLNLGAGGVDGRFGQDTIKALRRFQRRYGLHASGVVDEQTRRALNHVAKLYAAKERVKPGSTLEQAAFEDRDLPSRDLLEAALAREAAEGAGRGIPSARAAERILRTRYLEDTVTEINEAGYDDRQHPRGRGGQWIKKGVKVKLPAGGGATSEGVVHSISGDQAVIRNVDGVRGNEAVVKLDRLQQVGGKGGKGSSGGSSGSGGGGRYTKELYRDSDGHEVWRIKDPSGKVIQSGIASDHDVEANLNDYNDSLKKKGKLGEAVERLLVAERELVEAAGDRNAGTRLHLAERALDAELDRAATDLLRESKDTARLSVTHAPKGKGGTNWITKSKPGNTGELPAYIQNVRNAIMRGGASIGRATAIAIGRIRKWAAGAGDVSAEVRAAAAKAIAEYEAMRAKAKAS